MKKSIKYPHSGIYWSSNNKTRPEVVIFVHHFGGNRHSYKRHIELLNANGFDCISFNLSHNHGFKWWDPPFGSNEKFGYRHIWADEIESIINRCPDPVILFSFSSPSIATLNAMSRRNYYNIKAWICDGGPFFDAERCIYLYIQHMKGIDISMVKHTASKATMAWWGLVGYESEVKQILEKFPKDLPILSIRCENDKLVPQECIEKVFAGHDLNLTKLVIKDAEHLMGLKTHPEIYSEKLLSFLDDKVEKEKALRKTSY